MTEQCLKVDQSRHFCRREYNTYLWRPWEVIPTILDRLIPSKGVTAFYLYLDKFMILIQSIRRLSIPLLLFLSGIQLSGQSVLDKLNDELESVATEYIIDGAVDYAAIARDSTFTRIYDLFKEVELKNLNTEERKAHLINAYNFLTIASIAEAYPVISVREIGGFFSGNKYELGKDRYTLDMIEKEELFGGWKDARLHFALICGAKDCPRIYRGVYHANNLELQLDSTTKLVLNDRRFIRVNAIDKTVDISMIFKWYGDDFGSNFQETIEYINALRNTRLPSDYTIGFYEYNWSLNEFVGKSAISNLAENSYRYVVSSTVPKGVTELKVFNNLYTQKTRDGSEFSNRDSYFTGMLSYLYGLNGRLNIGFDVRYRRVALSDADKSPLAVFSFKDVEHSRDALASFGPKIRWAPFRDWANFSIQSALWFQLQPDLEGNGDLPFLDWNGPIWFTQVFNDFDIGTSYSFFTEVDLLFEDLGSDNDDLNRFATPITGIFSYFPTTKTSVYALGNLSPYWSPELDFFAQLGLGIKHQITRSFELELLYTAFTNAFLFDNRGRAGTYNLGLRYTR